MEMQWDAKAKMGKAKLLEEVLWFSAFLPLSPALSLPFADILKQMEEMKKGTWRKLREKFSAKKPEEDSK